MKTLLALTVTALLLSQGVTLRPGRPHCESVRMLQLADRINREDGLDALRSWLEEVRPRCQLETGAVVVNVVELDEKQAPHPRKTIIGLRSDAWEGTRYGFREDLE